MKVNKSSEFFQKWDSPAWAVIRFGSGVAGHSRVTGHRDASGRFWVNLGSFWVKKMGIPGEQRKIGSRKTAYFYWIYWRAREDSNPRPRA